jgi:tryptophan synthase alpha chain
MNRIDIVFAEKRSIRIMPFVEAGLPSMAATLDIITACEKGGASVIELGIPFSDPVADGPTIQKASFQSLKAGTSLAASLKLISQLRRTSEIPVIVFTYYNPVLAMGLERFCKRAAASGADAVLIPDLPLEESLVVQHAAEAHGLHLIYLVAPTSSDARIKAIAKQARGFIYVVAVKGVTGARSSLNTSVTPLLKRIRRHTKLPLCVGFGISEKRHVSALVGQADGAVVGSALVNLIMKSKRAELTKKVQSFIRKLAP